MNYIDAVNNYIPRWREEAAKYDKDFAYDDIENPIFASAADMADKHTQPFAQPMPAEDVIEPLMEEDFSEKTPVEMIRDTHSQIIIGGDEMQRFALLNTSLPSWLEMKRIHVLTLDYMSWDMFLNSIGADRDVIRVYNAGTDPETERKFLHKLLEIAENEEPEKMILILDNLLPDRKYIKRLQSLIKETGLQLVLTMDSEAAALKEELQESMKYFSPVLFLRSDSFRSEELNNLVGVASDSIATTIQTLPEGDVLLYHAKLFEHLSGLYEPIAKRRHAAQIRIEPKVIAHALYKTPETVRKDGVSRKEEKPRKGNNSETGRKDYEQLELNLQPPADFETAQKTPETDSKSNPGHQMPAEASQTAAETVEMARKTSAAGPDSSATVLNSQEGMDWEAQIFETDQREDPYAAPETDWDHLAELAMEQHPEAETTPFKTFTPISSGDEEEEESLVDTEPLRKEETPPGFKDYDPFA